VKRHLIWVQFMQAALSNEHFSAAGAARVADDAMGEYMKRYLTEQRSDEYQEDA
jgi:hypothetical protein